MVVSHRILLILYEFKTNISCFALAKQCNISIEQVYFCIQELKEQGFPIIQIKDDVFLRYTDIELTEKIVSFLRTTKGKVIVKETIDSTQRLALELAKQEVEHATAVLAKEQSAGIGRRGANFFSPANTGLYLSIILYFSQETFSDARITAAVAVLLRNILTEQGAKGISIKWVNDLYNSNYKKCAGILIQKIMPLEKKQKVCFVIGAGLNVFEPVKGYPKEVENIAGAVFSQREDANIAVLAAKLIDGLTNLEHFMQTDFMSDYRKYSCVLGKQIWVEQQDSTIPAVATAILDDARLLVETQEEQKILAFGEVRLRL